MGQHISCGGQIAKDNVKGGGDMKNKIWLFGLVVLLSLIPIAVFAQNEPPVADAGADQNVYTGDAVYLYGSATDAENDPIQWWWWNVIDYPSGSSWELLNGNAQHAVFQPFTPGRYLVTLMVDDGYGTSAPDIITITVTDNLPPVAIATADKTEGPAPLTVQFYGSQSYDPEGKPIVMYLWEFGDGSAPSLAATPPPHTYTMPGTYNVVILTVSDECGANGSDTLVITVTEPGITLEVCTATVKWWNAQKTMGAVSLWAGFDAEIPARGDMVAIYFDNIQLFAAPFSKFKHGLLPGAYWLTKNSILVRFDFTNNQLLVVTPKMNLVGLDNVNGVDVELMIGSDMATENIMMKASHFNTLIYRSPGCLGEPQ
jgi:hypothetical protein